MLQRLLACYLGMSWLTGLAGKAENLLNTLDSSAGEALNKGSEDGSERLQQQFPSYAEHQNLSAPLTHSPSRTPTSHAVSTPPISRSHSQASNLSGNGVGKRIQQSQADKDAELLQFLNSDTPVNPPPVLPITRRGATHSQTHSRASSITSGFSKVSVSEVAEAGVQPPTALGQAAASAASSKISEQPSSSATTESADPASLELENKLLRSEVSSLSQEVSALLRRNQTGAEKQKQSAEELQRMREQLSSVEDQLRSSRSAEADLIEQVQVKDSQAAALRMELQEARLKVEDLRTQLSDMRSDQQGMSDVSHQALEELRVKALRAEESLAREQNNSRSLQEEVQRAQAAAEEARVRLSEAAADQRRALAEERRKAESVNFEMEGMRKRADQAQSELREYKEKAAKILSMKERMISTLKSGGSGRVEGGSAIGAGGESEADPAQLAAELESVRHERELLREEVQRAKWNSETMQCDMQELEMQAQSESETFRRNMAALERQLESERGARSAAEEELLAVRRESGFLTERATREKTDLSGRLSEKEAEIERLRRQVTLKSQNGGQEQAELEHRVRSLTENLIQKQTTIEAVGAERNSLRLKVEHLERQLTERHQIQALMSGPGSGVDDLGVGGDRQYLSVPHQSRRVSSEYMKINMADPPIAKNMKRAVNTLDSAGVRFGVFLRRYPPARLFFLVYILVLHLWVAVVLLTYQPEVHVGDWPAPGVKPLAPQPPSSLKSAVHRPPSLVRPGSGS